MVGVKQYTCQKHGQIPEAFTLSIAISPRTVFCTACLVEYLAKQVGVLVPVDEPERG